MMDFNLDLRALFTYALSVFKKYASFVIGVSFTYLVFGLVPQIYIYYLNPENPAAQSPIVYIIVLVVRLIITLGFIKIMLYLIDDRQVSVADLINNWDIFLSYVTGWFMFRIAVVIGLFLFIVPGLYLAMRLQFYSYYIIEYGDPSWKAIQKSWQATEGYFLELVAFGFCFLVLNFIGAMLFGFGMVFTYPITILAQAVIFKSLEQDTDQIPVSEYKPQ